MTFAEFFDDYAARQIWTPQSARTADLAARTFPDRGARLRDLRSTTIERWVRAMHDDGLAAATIRTRVAVVSATLAAAVRDGLILANPAQGVRLPRAATRSRTATMPSEAQVSLLVATSAPPYDAIFALAAYAGLRLGEARALRWDDVDLDAGLLWVRRQLRLTPGGGQDESTPKYGSYRKVPLQPELHRYLYRHAESGHDLVAEARSGVPAHPGSIARVWARQKASCGLPSGTRIHDLRHWYASRLIADGVDVLTVQRRLGHARPSTTLDVYGHVLPDYA